MGRKDQEPSTTTGSPQPPADPATENYQPPQVMWEEEFAPVADSICIVDRLDPSCQ